MAAPAPARLPALRRPPRRRPVTRLLPHRRYVCTLHQFWVGPPDAGQPAAPLGPGLADITQAKRRHLRLLRCHGTALTYDAVLTGFLICGHQWDYQPHGWDTPWHRWNQRAQALIPAGLEATRFSASRIFAAAYPEAVDLASVISSPRWRSLAAGDPAQRQQFITEIGRRLGQPGYQPPDTGDAIAHWIEYDSWQPPSRPATTYPQTRDHGTSRPAAVSQQSRQRQERSALFYALNRRGGNVILHHRHIRTVLVRDWSPAMDGITATIWASQTTLHHGWPEQHRAPRSTAARAGNEEKQPGGKRGSSGIRVDRADFQDLVREP